MDIRQSQANAISEVRLLQGASPDDEVQEKLSPAAWDYLKALVAAKPGYTKDVLVDRRNVAASIADQLPLLPGLEKQGREFWSLFDEVVRSYPIKEEATTHFRVRVAIVSEPEGSAGTHEPAVEPEESAVVVGVDCDTGTAHFHSIAPVKQPEEG
jgi:hypothetical protein